MLGLATGISAAAGLAKGIVGMIAHNKYAKQLEEMKMKMPGAIGQAEGVYSDLAYGNMPGYDTMLGNVDSGVASTMTQVKRVATSPSALIDALIQSETSGEVQKRDIETKNALYGAQQQSQLGRFLSTVKSPAQQRIIQFDIDKKIAAAKERMQGVNELMQGVSGGIGSAFSTFGQENKLGFMQDQNEMMKKYWDFQLQNLQTQLPPFNQTYAQGGNWG